MACFMSFVRTGARLATAIALLAVVGSAGRASAADRESDAARLDVALAKLDAQMPLSAADRNALKKAASVRRVTGLRVCGDPGNLPLSDINRAGYENKIIELLAEEMGTYVTYYWRPYLERGITRQTFDAGECDVLLDLPAGFERVLPTEPIYRSTYVLAYRSDRGLDLTGLDDPKLKDLKIGTYQTSGVRTALARRGIRNVSLHVLSHNSDLNPENQPWKQVEQVLQGKLDVAAVWGPFAGWLKAKGEPLIVQPVNIGEDEVPLEFDLVIGLRKVDWVLKYKFDMALEARKADIEKILRAYGVPLVQCSRCVVAGDLPSHGIYTAALEQSDTPSVSPAPDQQVTMEKLKAWLKDGADINEELANAVLAGDLARISFLIEHGADINRLDRDGYAALHSAARNRRADLISVLIAYKADLNLKDRDGFTALHHAVLSNHPASIEALVKRGADIEAAGPSGLTPLAMAIIEDKYKSAMTLIAAGAQVNTPVSDEKLTPLMLVAGKDGRILSLGAGVSRIEKLDPKDPGLLEVAQGLIEKGANVNAVAASGATALLLAAAHDNAPIVGLLVQSGADQSAKTSDGKTALNLAKANGNTVVVSLLTLLAQSGNN